jgi:hypothetical protein
MVKYQMQFMEFELTHLDADGHRQRWGRTQAFLMQPFVCSEV